MNIQQQNTSTWRTKLSRTWFNYRWFPAILSVLSLSLLITVTAAARGGQTYYKVCGGGNRYVEFERDSVTVNTMDDNLIEFTSDNGRHSAKRVPGFDLMEGGKDVYNIDRFYAAKMDDNSFVVLQKGGMHTGFSYFHTDQRLANSNDKSVRCAFERLVRFEAQVDAWLVRKGELDKQKKAEFDSQTKGVATEFVKNWRSQRVDPVLEKGIRSWWRGVPDAVVVDPMLRIIFLQPNYDIVRNDYGMVLRKTIDTIYVFKRTAMGKCFAAWRSFGYESYGGGTFSEGVKNWIKRDWVGHPNFIRMPGDRKMVAAEAYEVDCGIFAQ